MSKREDIIDASEVYKTDGSIRNYGLIYTKKCGWVDLGHANPESAKKLWKTILSQTVNNMCLTRGTSDAVIVYSQEMRKLGMSAGKMRRYEVRRELSPAEQKSIALAIFMDVSIAFEGLQSNWFFKHVTDSGYSVEDLVSDLIGFYRAVYPAIDYIKICEPVSKAESLAIWDAYGAVGENKNKEFKPVLYPNPLLVCGIPKLAELPPELNTIRPAVMGGKVRRIQ